MGIYRIDRSEWFQHLYGTARSNQGRAWRSVLLRDPCVYCGRPAKALDHVHPANYGGADTWENRAPACKGCNEMKADGSLLWMLWRLNERRFGRVRRRVIGHRIVKGQRIPIRSLLEYQGMLERPRMLAAVDPVGELAERDPSTRVSPSHVSSWQTSDEPKEGQ